MVMEKLIGINIIKKVLNCSEATAMDHIMRRGLPAKKVDGEWQITKKKLDKWIKNR